MILNDTIIEDVKRKSGLLFDNVGDFSILSNLIFKETHRTIGITTLKRLFNYTNDDRNASDYTLNTIAIFLGNHDWKSYVSNKNLESDWEFHEETVYVQALSVGDAITIRYLDRTVAFEVCESEERNALLVTSSVNSSLRLGDLLFVYRIRKGEPLEAEKVIRGKDVGNYRTHGEVTFIEITTKNN